MTKVSLRVLEKSDLEFLHKLNNNADIMSYWFEEPYYSMIHLENMYEKTHENHRLFILAKGKERLGFVGLFSIEPIHRKAEFGIMIDPKHQGHGYARIATNLALDYAFLNLNLHKLYLIVDETNEKAIYIYQKAGFNVEGVLKDEFFIRGSYHNVIHMSVFQKDFLQDKKTRV